jgi:hypothetical protein
VEVPEAVTKAGTCPLVQLCQKMVNFYTHLPAYEDGTQGVPKRRHINFRRLGITQEKACSMLNDSICYNQLDAHMFYFVI